MTCTPSGTVPDTYSCFSSATPCQSAPSPPTAYSSPKPVFTTAWRRPGSPDFRAVMYALARCPKLRHGEQRPDTQNEAVSLSAKDPPIVPSFSTFCPGATNTPRAFILFFADSSIRDPQFWQVSLAFLNACCGVESFGHVKSLNLGMKNSSHSGHGHAHSNRVPSCHSFQIGEVTSSETSQCSRPV